MLVHSNKRGAVALRPEVGEVGEALEGLVLQQHDTLSGVSNARQEYQGVRALSTLRVPLNQDSLAAGCCWLTWGPLHTCSSYLQAMR